MAAGRLSGLDTAFLCLDREVSPTASWRLGDLPAGPVRQRLAEAIQPAAAALDRQRV